jgi:transcriptional regulator with XRE-family HTH domain
MMQRRLAEEVGVHLSQLRRYGAGTSQPTLEVLHRMAIALRVSADALLFDAQERGPDEEQRL